MYKRMVTESVNILKQNNDSNSKHNHKEHEAKALKSIQSKLQNNDATFTRADKGNSIVILPTKQYNSKLKEF
jgi:hypothetical protein